MPCEFNNCISVLVSLRFVLFNFIFNFSIFTLFDIEPGSVLLVTPSQALNYLLACCKQQKVPRMGVKQYMVFFTSRDLF